MSRGVICDKVRVSLNYLTQLPVTSRGMLFRLRTLCTIQTDSVLSFRPRQILIFFFYCARRKTKIQFGFRLRFNAHICGVIRIFKCFHHSLQWYIDVREDFFLNRCCSVLPQSIQVIFIAFTVLVHQRDCQQITGSSVGT